MIRKITGLSLLATALFGLFPLACAPGGVGDPCIPEDEYRVEFSGYNAKEVNVESKSFQCETRVCLANHFQGRVSCKYGQEAGAGNCTRPGDKSQPITVAVDAQLKNRTAEKAVYCSCRCDGEDKNARYCKCPSGYACTKLQEDYHLGSAQLAGSYCVRDGTGYDPADSETCSPKGYPKTGSSPTCGEPSEL
ncbi:MAG TPA: hypothetical protein VHM25_22345 [Polyangiaceae bacterium]|jgi:hypothetical protein|nr:hypothetical protein [Polyangiaceae bacterium]